MPAEKKSEKSKHDLLEILLLMDIQGFREVCDMGGTDEEVLHALHLVRVDHPGVNKGQKDVSATYLLKHGIKSGAIKPF